MDLSRTEILLTKSKITRILNSSVCIFGIGGVGSYAAEAIARSGVGSITLIDCDKIAPSNINRQIHALCSTVGKYKTQVMKERILDINPDAKVTTHEVFCTPDNIAELIPEKCDYIIDAVDNVTAKIHIAIYANQRNIPVISSMGTANKLNPSMFKIDDIYNTRVCPLCKVMRRELKKRGVTSLCVLYSEEEPIKSGKLGSVSFVPSAAGLMIAGHVINYIASDAAKEI